MIWSSPCAETTPDLATLERCYAALAGAYVELDAEARARAVTWRWASNDCHDLRPLHYERHGFTRGRMMTKAPDPVANHYEYGFDALGRVVLERQYVAFKHAPDRRWAYDTFTVWHDQDCAVEQMRFSYAPDDKAPIAYHHGVLCDGRLAVWASRATYGIERERYHWHPDGRIAAVDIDRTDLETGPVTEPEPFQRVLPHYDDELRLDQVDVLWLPFGNRSRSTLVTPWKRRKRSARAS